MKSGPLILALESLLYPLLLFVFTPYIIDVIGTDGYGLWSYVNAAIGAGSVFSFGTAMAAVRILSADIGSARQEVIDTSVRSILGIFFLQGLVVAAAVCVLVLGMVPSGEASIWAGGALVLYGVTISILEQMDVALSSILRAGQHFSAMLKYDVMVRIAQLGLAYAAGRWLGLSAMLVIFVLVAALRLTLKVAVARGLMFRTLDWFGPYRLMPIAAQARFGWLQGGMGGIMFFADRLFAGHLLGPHAVALLSVLTLIPQQFHAVSVAAISYVYPRMARQRSENALAWSTARANILKLSGGIAIVLLLTAAALAWLSDWFLALWLKGRFGPNIAPLFVLVFWSYLLQLLNAPSYFLLGAYNRNGLLTIMMSVAGVLSLALLQPLITCYGMYGAAYGKIFYGVLCLSMLVYVWVRPHENSHSQ